LAYLLSLATAQAYPIIGKIIACDSEGYFFHITYYYSPMNPKTKVFGGKEYDIVQSNAVYVIRTDHFGITDYFVNHTRDYVLGSDLYIRKEKSGKTFRYNTDSGMEEVLIDPTLNVGDVFTRPDGKTLMVTDVSEDDNGIRTLQLQGTDSDVKDTWRSDIGSIHSAFIPQDVFPDFTMEYVAYDLEHGYVANLDTKIAKTLIYDYKPSDELRENWSMYFMDECEGIMEYSMSDGMLHVKGFYSGSQDSPNYAECLIKDQCLYMNFSMLSNNATYSKNFADIDLYFGPFEPGVYSVYTNYAEPLMTTIAYKPNQPEYRLLVEKGKTWKVGWFPSDAAENEARQIHIYTLEGDTLVGGQQCVKMMHETQCSPDYPLEDGSLSRKEYAGALYEKDREVFYALPRTDSFVKLYAFIPFQEYNEQYSIIYKKNILVESSLKKYIATDAYKGNVIRFRTSRRNSMNEYMLEGIGTEMGPLSGADAELLRQAGYRLMQCNVYDEILYDDPTLTDGVNQEEELAKRRIDFTHVTKPVLKAPRRAADGQEESVSGGYTPSELTIDTEMLSDTYQVVIKEKGITPIYTTTICGSQTLSLSIDINRWIAPFYTISLEGSTDHFMATFSPEDYVTAINEIFPGTDSDATSSNVPSTKKGIYDLQGRRLDHEPQHGVFIRDGRKVVK